MFLTNGGFCEGHWSEDGTKFQGREFDQNGKKMLIGFLTKKGDLHDGSSFEIIADGETKEIKYIKGKRTGRFAKTMPNGETYNGEWENELFHGQGIIT